MRLLARRDPYHRFYSCLIYVPRDRYNTEVRQRIEQIVLEGFDGKHVETQVQISDSNHARVHVVVRTDPDDRRKVDLPAIETSHRRGGDDLGRSTAARCSRASMTKRRALATRRPLSRARFRWRIEEDVEPARCAGGSCRSRSAAQPTPQAAAPQSLSASRQQKPSACT